MLLDRAHPPRPHPRLPSVQNAREVLASVGSPIVRKPVQRSRNRLLGRIRGGGGRFHPLAGLGRTLLHLSDRFGRTWSRVVTCDRREDTEQHKRATQEHESTRNHDQDRGPCGKTALLLRLVHVVLCHDSSFNFAWLFST